MGNKSNSFISYESGYTISMYRYLGGAEAVLLE